MAASGSSASIVCCDPTEAEAPAWRLLRTRMARSSTVLVADSPDAHALLAALLPQRSLRFVRTVEAAKLVLATTRIDAVVMGLHFDRSRGFALLEHMRVRPRYRDIPIICVRAMPSALPVALHRCLEQALRMTGVTAYVDVGALLQRPGRDRLSTLIDAHRRSATSTPDTEPEA